MISWSPMATNPKIPEIKYVSRCTICNKSFTAEEVANVKSCPNCDNPSPPLNPEEDLYVKINWHELKTLAVWAEGYAHIEDLNPDIVYAIAARLERQYPDLSPLTMASEIKSMRRQGINVISNHPSDDGTA